MIDFFRPTDPFGAQTMRLVAESLRGGGDVFDIACACRRITPGDTESWQAEWAALGAEAERRARVAFTNGRGRAAMRDFFAASQYFRQSAVFEPGAGARKRERFVKAQQNFKAGAKLHTPPVEVITVKCGGETYDGYFCHPATPPIGKWRAVMLIGGADAFAEEIFFSGHEIIERGIALLLVDTPGRGSSIFLKNLPIRADYEVPIKACIDWLAARPEVDASRIGLVGISMAGYYAPRAAAFDRRIKALIGWCGCYSLLDDLYEFCPHLRPTVQHIMGGLSDAEARARLPAFTLAGVAQNIVCPTLITHGVNDRLMNVEGAKRLFAAIGARDKTLKLWDGETGAGHCGYDAWNEQIPFMLDWLEARL